MAKNEREHCYEIEVRWTGNRGPGTASYRAYGRDLEIRARGKPTILGSSDPAFRGDPERWNPEDLFVAAVSTCHKLWYLHLCAEAGIVVHDYVDHAQGRMLEDATGAGRFTEITLRPEVSLAPGADLEKARALHTRAHAMCFIANSIAVPVTIEPKFGLLQE
jgi:organic hydroperoxide reductase OsmC/OhrA